MCAGDAPVCMRRQKQQKQTLHTYLTVVKAGSTLQPAWHPAAAPKPPPNPSLFPLTVWYCVLVLCAGQHDADLSIFDVFGPFSHWALLRTPHFKATLSCLWLCWCPATTLLLVAGPA